MATIYPVIVSSSEELDKAASENKAVILVVNKDLIPAVKKEIREDTKKEAKFRKAANTTAKGAKTAVTGTVAAGVATLVGAPILALPALAAVVAGTVVSYGGFVTTLIRGKDVQAAHPGLLSKLNHYVWNEVFEERYLLLVKIEGRNMYNPKTDIISFDEIRGIG